MRHQLLAGAAFGALLGAVSSGAALAADITPIYKARPAVVVDDYYVWADAMYERVNLPTYSLGYKRVGAGPAFPDLGAAQSFDPHLNGLGVRGAFGYRLPGSDLRLEAGGSIVVARADQSQSTGVAPNLSLQFLNGFQFNDGRNCTLPTTCTVDGTLQTSYTAWQLNGRALYDARFGNITVTPSVAVFGGTARADQTLSQALTQAFPGGAFIAGYAAETTLRWTDVGARRHRRQRRGDRYPHAGDRRLGRHRPPSRLAVGQRRRYLQLSHLEWREHDRGQRLDQRLPRQCRSLGRLEGQPEHDAARLRRRQL
jgi:hypothetical protein